MVAREAERTMLGGDTPGRVRPVFAGYRPEPGAYDELFEHDGRPRPHCRFFVDAIDQLGHDVIRRRWELAQRLLREIGIVEDAQVAGERQPRDLDPIPLLVAAEESVAIADGLAQRARLLERVLADLYGPQVLLRDGALPPALVFGNPAFLHPCHGQRPPEGRFLLLYAADLGRGPDGRWRVIADRTDAPSGAGYALENRLATSRMLPNVFHECRVQRLAPFFITLRETLARLAPRQRETARVVLLSKGPASKHYFEDTYLSRYLGYSLAEGGDLTVRDDRVFLKTLGGLLPVDVVLRRVPDALCDPLELARDSRAGVPGISQAVRAGSVIVASPLGSGLAQSPALAPFLPALCRTLLGEELRMPAVASYWCGDPEGCRITLERLESLVVKSASGSGGAFVGSRASAAELEAFRARIRARPELFVAQESACPSRAPVWTGTGLATAHVGLRSYAVAARNGYEVLLGGFSRVSRTPDPIDLSQIITERRKDVWVLSTGEVTAVSLLARAGQSIELRRSGADLPSRVADNLFWLGRHVERAEAAARLLRTTLSRLTGESDLRALAELPALARALLAQGQLSGPCDAPPGEHLLALLERMLPSTVFDNGRADSLRATISEAHRLASVVRDRISIDAWRIIHRIDREYQRTRLPGRDADLADLLVLLNPLLTDLAAFAGLMNESMTRGLGWRFLDLGRRIERALNMALLLGQMLLGEDEPSAPVLDALLEVADSGMTYHSRYLANLSFAPVLDLLLTDEQNPRSMAFQWVIISEHVEQLPRAVPRAYRDLEQRIAMSVLHELRMFDVTSVEGKASVAGRAALDGLLQRIERDLPALSDAIVHRFLLHASPARHLTDTPPDSRREEQRPDAAAE